VPNVGVPWSYVMGHDRVRHLHHDKGCGSSSHGQEFPTLPLDSNAVRNCGDY